MAKPKQASKKTAALCARSAAALAIAAVLKQEQSLSTHFESLGAKVSAGDIGLFKALCFGVLRFGFSLSAQADALLDKPLRNKDKDIFALLLIGIYQLDHLQTPAYAAVDSCVKAATKLKKNWAKGFLNATLRNYQKKSDALILNDAVLSEHPNWLRKRLIANWAEESHAIMSANNQEPPLCLRVNQQQTSRDVLINHLSDSGIEATPGKYASTALYIRDRSASLFDLDIFHAGHFSVQDEAAQLASEQFDLKPNQRVLDACAAPGGKTCHLLERESSLSLLAIDHDERRLQRVSENLSRLQLSAKMQCADVADIASWWDSQLFDHILCDVPCSATGVIRRHPDIKYLRKDSDIESLTSIQMAILQQLWQCLKPSGTLLYTTCSILKDENSKVIEQFLEQTPDAKLIPIKINALDKYPQTIGLQLFPEAMGHDGFFYAKLVKETAS